MFDYTMLYREQLPVEGRWPYDWDIFLSAYNTSMRVSTSFEMARAQRKYWLVHQEYQFERSQHPEASFLVCDSGREDEDMLDVFDQIFGEQPLAGKRICIDITGMMRPHLMFLVKLLVNRGASKLDVIYSEPSSYALRENTKFSGGSVHRVRQVANYESTDNSIDTSNDVLIIGAGYEDELIKEVADDKDRARKIVVYGFPSLRADMYQQNLLRTRRASDALGEVGTKKHFAPANDPFVTASVLSAIVERENSIRPITNLYLSPLSTKAQALGFALFFMFEREGSNTSIIYPYSSQYAQGASDGLYKIWLYRLEFPSIP